MSCKNYVGLPREVQHRRWVWWGFLWLTRKLIQQFYLELLFELEIKTQNKTWRKEGEMGKTKLCGSNESL